MPPETPRPLRPLPPERKPPTPAAVRLVTVRCWHCGRIVAEAEAGHWLRIKCRCNAWVCEEIAA